MLFRSWAWAARGHGYVSSIAPQQWIVFAQRLEMARAALLDAQRATRPSPLSYQLALQLGVDTSQSKEQLRAIFETGVAEYPQFYSLYSAMLRALMPRWLGSYQEVDEFIEEMAGRSEGRELEMYARLYSMFAMLEGDDTDLFESTPAQWSRMKEGYESMVSRYPRSDSTKNAFAAYACRAGDADTYRSARAAIGKVVETAWTEKFSPQSCDSRLL